jgi:hypothetical protein
MQAFKHEGFGVHSIRRVALNIRWDRFIVSCNDVPRGLRTPSRYGDFVAEASHCQRALRDINDIGLIRWDVLHEMFANALEGQGNVAFAIGLDF